jgi:hypothetical protein
MNTGNLHYISYRYLKPLIIKFHYKKTKVNSRINVTATSYFFIEGTASHNVTLPGFLYLVPNHTYITRKLVATRIERQTYTLTQPT